MTRSILPPLVVAMVFAMIVAIIAACGSSRDARGTQSSAALGSSPVTTSAASAVLSVFGDRQPDELPALVTTALPFKYPAALYARRVQGNVTLKLFIDRDGRVVHDSTRVEEASGFAALDSAALAGAGELRFVPAKVRGEPLPLSILFPVYFRHPEARPLPGDTILNSGKSG
jgi:protein TonB